MELFETLNAYGLSFKILQFLIILAGIIIFLGLFWRYIAIGAGVLFVAMAFLLPISNASVTNSPQKKIEDLRKKDFMGDCQHYGDTKQKCEEIWNERLSEESKL